MQLICLCIDFISFESMNNLSKTAAKYLKIGEAANYLSVSIDTLRRWEKIGKIKTIKTPKGTRLFALRELNRIKYDKDQSGSIDKSQLLGELGISPKSLDRWQQDQVPTIDTTVRSIEDFFSEYQTQFSTDQIIDIKQRNPNLDQFDYPPITRSDKAIFNPKKSSKIVTSVLSLLFLGLLGVSALIGINFFTNSRTEDISGVIRDSNVLGISTLATEGRYLELNADTIINSGLAVDGQGSFTGNLTAPNLVYSITGRGDIQVSGGQNPIISFTLPTIVNSLNTLTGPLTLAVGGINSITTTGTTITITATETDTLATVTGRGAITGTNSTFTGTLTSSSFISPSVAISGGTINGTIIGGATPSTGAFTTLTASSTLNVSGAATFGSTITLGGLTYTWPSTQTANYLLTTNGSGTLSWIDPGSVITPYWNSIANPNANQSLTMGTYTSSWNWATGTGTDNLFNLTTDASANGTGSLLNIQTGTSSTLSPFRVRAGSTEALFVNSSGNLGIGNTSPGTKLDVTGTGRFSSTLTASDGLTMTTGALSLTSTSGSINSTGLTALTQTLSSGIAAITAPTLNLNTSSTGNTSIGNGTGTFSLDSSAFDVSTAGALSGITTISTSGAINSQTISSAANLTGTLTLASTLTLSSLTTNGGVLYTNGTSGTVAQTTAGTSGQVLTSNAGGAPTWTDQGALSVRWNSIANPNGNQSLSMTTYTSSWNWATVPDVPLV